MNRPPNRLKNLGMKTEVRYLGNRTLTLNAPHQPPRTIAAHQMTFCGFGNYTVQPDGRTVYVPLSVYRHLCPT